jgi:hypothetical protein
LGEGNSSCSNKAPSSLQRGDNHKNVKMGCGHLKIFFSRTTGPILTRLGTNYPWRKRIQLSLKEGDSPFLRGDNCERVKIHRKFLEIFFRTCAKIIQTWYKLSLGERKSREFKFVQIKGQALFKGG